MRRAIVLLGLTILLTACAAPDPEIVYQPSPYPVETEIIIPSPYPVPGPTVEVVPTECKAAFDELVDNHSMALEFIIAIFDDYLDYPDEDLAEFGKRVEDRLNAAPEFIGDISYTACGL